MIPKCTTVKPQNLSLVTGVTCLLLIKPSERDSRKRLQSSSLDYLRQQQPGGLPPRSGYEELDTTLMPPRPGAGVPGATQGAELYNRASPAPGSEAGHNQGYAGRE